MSYSAMIPLRTRESFFRDPFFSDCWDLMDRRRKDWEHECNLRSRSFMSDLDDMDMGFGSRGLGRSSLGRIFNNRAGAHDLLEKDDFLKSSNSSDTFGLQTDKDNFKVLLDVQQFNPEELSVKTCDNTIVIEGKHEDKKDPHGYVSRHFTRKYTVPSDVKVEDVQCNLSSDGVLHVTAPRLNPAITNKATASATSTEQRRSAERETYSSASTAKEYPEQRRATPEKEGQGQSSRSSDRLREELSSSSRIGNKSTFDNLKDSDRFGSRLFDSSYSGFPDFDLVPFWRRRDWSGGQGEIIDRQSNNRTTFGLLSDRENFKVQLDVQQFTPEELSVKTVDNVLVIEGKHDEKKDSLGLVQRHFTRKYDIPSDVKPEDVKCSFSSDGLLVVSAPRQRPQLTNNEKVTVIPISVKHQSLSSQSQTEKLRSQSGKSVESQSDSQSWKSVESQKSSGEDSSKQHSIRVEKQSSTTAPITNKNGVLIEEQISRSSSNQDAHKEMNGKAQSHYQEGIVEHIIPITNGN